MTERDEGDRLRREFLRQAPPFDLGATLEKRVSALVRRRQRVRRILAVGAAAAVVAAVAIPLSALRSTPVGHGFAPATTPATVPTTPPPTPVVYPPVSCDTLDLWHTPAGTAVSTTATSGAVVVTLTGTAVTVAGGDPGLTGAELTVTIGGSHFSESVAPPAQTSDVTPWSLTPAASPSGAPNSDALCLALFPGDTTPTVVLGLSTGGAHCCTVVRAIALSSAGLAPPVDDDLGNAGATLENGPHGATIVTADNAFAYQFSSFAGSGLPVEVLQFSQGRFVAVTSQRPDLIATDAALWWRTFNANPGSGLGVLAPWVADQCALGQATTAWATVDQLLAQGKLIGPTEWPQGSAYVAALKTFLAKQGYC
jgi:hypothetical protein